MENFAWNIRVLKGQADLLSQAKKDCNEYIRQIKEAAISTGLDKEVNLTVSENTDGGVSPCSDTAGDAQL
jgi:hypothetical protein